MRLTGFGTVTLLLLSCTNGQMPQDEESLLSGQESSLRGMMVTEDASMEDGMELETTVERDLTSTKKQTDTTVREGRSHVSEGRVGDSLGRKEEVMDSAASTKTGSFASKKVAASSTSSGKKPTARTSNTTDSTVAKKASVGTKKVAGSAGKAQRSSNGKALGKTSETTKGVARAKTEAVVESEEDESDASEAIASFSSYSTGVYAPSICGTSRPAVEAFCNTERPICKYQTRQASGHEPFHVTEILRPNQGDCIRRCDSKWGLSERHCLDGETCFEGLASCTKCSTLFKPGCEPF